MEHLDAEHTVFVDWRSLNGSQRHQHRCDCQKSWSHFNFVFHLCTCFAVFRKLFFVPLKSMVESFQKMMFRLESLTLNWYLFGSERPLNRKILSTLSPLPQNAEHHLSHLCAVSCIVVVFSLAPKDHSTAFVCFYFNSSLIRLHFHRILIWACSTHARLGEARTNCHSPFPFWVQFSYAFFILLHRLQHTKLYIGNFFTNECTESTEYFIMNDVLEPIIKMD